MLPLTLFAFQSVALDSSPGDEDRNGSTNLLRILRVYFV